MSSVAHDVTTSKYRLGLLITVLAGEKFPRQFRGAFISSKNGFKVEKKTPKIEYMFSS
jgi:hypothetical protein